MPLSSDQQSQLSDPGAESEARDLEIPESGEGLRESVLERAVRTRKVWLIVLGVLILGYASYAFFFGELRISLWVLVLVGMFLWKLRSPRPAGARPGGGAEEPGG